MPSNERNFYMAEFTRSSPSRTEQYLVERVGFLKYQVRRAIPTERSLIDNLRMPDGYVLHKARWKEKGYSLRPLTDKEVFLLEL